MDLILIGIQGSGKGTQARILAKEKGYIIFETGAELRKIAQTETKLGQKIKEIIEGGNLVDNKIVMEIVEKFLQTIHEKNIQSPIIFDGVPRSEKQRQTFEALLQKYERTFEAIEIQIDEEEVKKRLKKRAILEGRTDDTQHVIQKRLDNFHAHTKPLLDVWKKAEKLKVIQGNQPPEEVTKKLFQILFNH